MHNSLMSHEMYRYCIVPILCLFRCIDLCTNVLKDIIVQLACNFVEITILANNAIIYIFSFSKTCGTFLNKKKKLYWLIIIISQLTFLSFFFFFYFFCSCLDLVLTLSWSPFWLDFRLDLYSALVVLTVYEYKRNNHANISVCSTCTSA